MCSICQPWLRIPPWSNTCWSKGCLFTTGNDCWNVLLAISCFKCQNVWKLSVLMETFLPAMIRKPHATTHWTTRKSTSVSKATISGIFANWNCGLPQTKLYTSYYTVFWHSSSCDFTWFLQGVVLVVWALEITSLLVEIFQQLIRGFFFVFKATSANKIDHTMWKGMDYCFQ